MPTPLVPPSDPIAALAQRIASIEGALAGILGRSPIAGTGLSVPGPGIVQVDDAIQSANYAAAATGWRLNGSSVELNTGVVSGLVVVDDAIQSANYSAGTAGWRFDGDSAEINAGVILEGALANLIKPAVAPAVTQTAWATTTGLVTKASTTVTVPAGFTDAQVTALATVVFQDAAPNRFDCRTRIAGVNGPTIIGLANLVGSASPSQTLVLTSLFGGQVITIDVQVSSAVATGGAAANQAVITAAVVFTR